MSSEHLKHTCHDHDHHHEVQHEWGRLFAIGIILNTLFVLIELGFGFGYGSLALMADATHNLTDVFGLLLAWFGFYLTQKSSSPHYAHWTAFLNSLLLVGGSVWIMYEAYERFQSPQPQVPWVVISVAAVGFVINFFSAKLFHRHQHDLNMKSAYLHLLGDAAISLGVAISGVLMYFFGWFWLDSVMSFTISAVIIVGSFGVLRASYKEISK